MRVIAKQVEVLTYCMSNVAGSWEGVNANSERSLVVLAALPRLMEEEEGGGCIDQIDQTTLLHIIRHGR